MQRHINRVSRTPVIHLGLLDFPSAIHRIDGNRIAAAG